MNPFAPKVTYFSAPCGSGKTEKICDMVQDDHDFTNFMIVLPTIDLVEEVTKKLSKRGLPVTVTTGKTVASHETVAAAIVKKLKNAPEQGLILVITWNAYSTISFFPARDNWQIIVDEIPPVDTFFSLPLDLAKETILGACVIHDAKYKGIYRLAPTNSNRLRKNPAHHIIDDKLKKAVMDLSRAIASQNRVVFIAKDDWDRLSQPQSNDDPDIPFLGSPLFHVGSLRSNLPAIR